MAPEPPSCHGGKDGTHLPDTTTTADTAKARFRWNLYKSLAKPPKRAKPTALLRTLTVRFVEINRLSDIDIMNQCFKAEFVLQLAFENGAHDEFLVDSSPDFPLDAWGRPNFRPSAQWYMRQVDFNNAIEYKQLDARVVVEGSDLLMMLRFEGTFAQPMDLLDFPCDVQDLTISLAFNCRTTGMMPVEVVTSPDLKTAISPEGFVGGKMWSMHDEVEVKGGVTGTHADRMFPCVQMVLLAGRHPEYFLLNIAAPTFFFVPMAALQFCVPRNFVADRLTVTLAIVLTGVAHKYSITTLVPAVSYLTALDKYVLYSLLLVMVIAFQGALLGSLETFYCRTQAVWDDGSQEETAVTEEEEDGAEVIVRQRRGVAAATVPLYYNDPSCPFVANGRFGMFDVIDATLVIIDMTMWLLLQLWALREYRRTRHTFASRVSTISAAQESRRKQAVIKRMESGKLPLPSTLTRVASSLSGSPAKPPARRGSNSGLTTGCRGSRRGGNTLTRARDKVLKNFAHHRSRPEGVMEDADHFEKIEREAAASRIQATVRGRQTRQWTSTRLKLSSAPPAGPPPLLETQPARAEPNEEPSATPQAAAASAAASTPSAVDTGLRCASASACAPVSGTRLRKLPGLLAASPPRMMPPPANGLGK